MEQTFTKLSQLKTPNEFRAYLREIGADFDLVDEARLGADSAFATPYEYRSKITGKTRIFRNRWALLPMEGWDCESNGAPSELARRRWLRNAESGASAVTVIAAPSLPKASSSS